MSATGLRVRAFVRTRVRPLLVTAVLVGVIAGTVIGLAAGTRRTASAPDRFTTNAGGDPDLTVMQQQGLPLTDQIAGIPGVTDATSIAFVASFLISPIDGSPVVEPNPFAGDDRLLGTTLVEGRFTDPAAPNEFTVNRSFAQLLSDRFGTKVGDVFQVASYDQLQLADPSFDFSGPPRIAPFDATLVGITKSTSEFDDPTPQLVFSQSFLSAHPTAGVVQTMIAVDVEAAADPDAVMSAVRELPDGENAFNVPTRVVSTASRRAVSFQTTALWLVTAIALIAGGVVITLLVARLLRVGDNERSPLTALGWRRGDIALERAIEGVATAAIATPVAVVVGAAVTAMFPLGVLEEFEPDPGLRMDPLATAIGIVVMVVTVVAIATVVGWRRSRPPTRNATDRWTDSIAKAGAGMPLTTGAQITARGSTGTSSSLGSMVVAAIGFAGLVAAGIVGLSLTRIVDRPDRWGVNYDQLFGNPYVPMYDDIATPFLGDADVVALSAASIGSVTIDGLDVATIGVDTKKGDLRPTALDGTGPGHGRRDRSRRRGRPPAGCRRGRHHRRRRVDRREEFEVVGIVVTPDSAGNGASMTFDSFGMLNPTATRNIVLVDFSETAPADVAEQVDGAAYTPPDALVKPTSIRALQRVTTAPFVLVVVLAACVARRVRLPAVDVATSAPTRPGRPARAGRRQPSTEGSHPLARHAVGGRGGRARCSDRRRRRPLGGAAADQRARHRARRRRPDRAAPRCGRRHRRHRQSARAAARCSRRASRTCATSPSTGECGGNPPQTSGRRRLVSIFTPGPMVELTVILRR